MLPGDEYLLRRYLGGNLNGDMRVTEMIGLLAAILTTASFLPQAIMVLRTRNTAGISLAMYIMFTLGVAGWLGYGLLIGSLPVTLANMVTLLLAAVILSIKVRAALPDKSARPQNTEHAANA